jgi:23S rRNA pseudouridine955/2504/2580 synthase
MSRRVRRPLAKIPRRAIARRARDRIGARSRRPPGIARAAPRFSAPRGSRRAVAEAPKPVAEPPPLPTKVQTVVVSADGSLYAGRPLLEAHFPGLFILAHQRIVRKGELRVNGKRADSKDRLQEGQNIRIPPLKLDVPKPAGHLSEAATKTLQALKDMILYEDADVMVLNKPAGLAVQGGSGTTRHIDQMLEVMRDAKGQKPRLVHRLDKETAGCLLVAKPVCRDRADRIVPPPLGAQDLLGAGRRRAEAEAGRISSYLAKEEGEEDTIMRIAAHGDEGAAMPRPMPLRRPRRRSSPGYRCRSPADPSIARTWRISITPSWAIRNISTGKTGSRRAARKPAVSLARRIVIPILAAAYDATAPLPPHMLQSWNLLGLEADRFDPIENAPEE